MVKKVIVSAVLLFMLGSLSACSAQELLTEVPGTAQLQVEDITKEKGNVSMESIATEGTASKQEGTEENSEPEVSFINENAYRYAYDCLPKEQKLWYRDIERALSGMEESVRLSDEGLAVGLDEGCIDRIFQCVLNDHPEFFYVSGYTYTKYSRGEEAVAISFSATYDMSLEEAKARKQEIEDAAEKILSGIDAEATEYDKVKYVYDTIIKNTDYDLEAPDNQNIYSVFVGKVSVCQGYAKAAQYLLNCLGIECTLVQGTVENGQGHAWNLVKVDDSFYYMDVTWGDASYQMSDEEMDSQQFPEISYDYLCITTNQLLKSHTLNNCVPLPECMDTAANYFVRQNLIFETYDKERLSELFWDMVVNGKRDITIKCADMSVFYEMKVALIDNQEIFDCMPTDKGSIGYATNDKQLSLTFWMTNQ